MTLFGDKEFYTCPVTGQKYDPLAVRRVFTLSKHYNEAARLMRSKDPVEAASGEEEVVAVGRAAFGLDPAVWTQSAVVRAVAAFTGWLAGKVERPQSSPAPAPSTDCRPA